MAIKSVIDIEINQEAFKEFESLFAKYQSNLGKMPGQWGKVGSATSNTAKTFNEAADALVRAAEAMQGIANAQDKVTKGQNKFNQFAQSTSKNFQEVSKSAIQIGKSVAATTLNLMKWVGIGGALGLVGGAGGLFGIGGLATSVGDTRKRAQGLGVTAGELKATETNFQRYTDVNALLSNLASAQTDIAKQYAFQANQLDANQSAADLLPKLLRRAGEVYKQGPAATAQQRLEATGLSALGISVEDARRYASLREDEIADVERKNRQDRKNFELNDELQRKWQDLDVQLSRAGYGIKKTFIEGLEGLVTPLNNLSDSFSNAVASFLSSDQIKTWIDNFGKSIDDFSGYLKTNQFKENVKDWLSMLGELKDSLSGLIVLLKPLQVLAPTNIEKGQEAVAKGDWWTASKKLPATDFISAVTKNIFGGKTEYKGTEATGIIPSEKLTNQQISENQKRAMQIWTEAGFQKHQVAGIAGNIQQESGFNPNAINLEGGKVHYGIGQWDAERQKDFEKLYGHKMQDKAFDQLKEQSEFLLYELKNKEYKAGKALERSKTVEEATNAILGFERPSRDPEILAKELSTRLGYATKIGGISAQAEAKQKLESENTQSPMNKSSYTSATTSSDNKYSSLGWNSSPVTLNINTIQPPGQVTNVNARQIGNWGAIR